VLFSTNANSTIRCIYEDHPKASVYIFLLCVFIYKDLTPEFTECPTL